MLVEKTNEPIITEFRDGAVATLTLNRQANRNSLSIDMLSALHTAIERLTKDNYTHVIVIAANGPAFCAGHDLKELSAARMAVDQGRGFIEYTLQACCRFMLSIMRCPKPVIASVQGTATAAGCQLVASCDLAIAADTAMFATPGVNIGLFCSTPMVALTRNVSRKAAMQMLLTGDQVTANEALSMGLVNTVVGQDRLNEETDQLAFKIAEKSPATLAVGKEAFYRQLEMGVTEAYVYTAKVMVENMMLQDAEEGICAFLEKRPAQWQRLSTR